MLLTPQKRNTPIAEDLKTEASRFVDTSREFPTKKEVVDVIPAKCFKRNTPLALAYASGSTLSTIACFYIGWNFIPLELVYLHLWIAYAVVTGTVATGCWVIAHECGHGAFSDNKTLQTFVGYTLHTALLVPYFSWQRSHAVHHMHTNHMTHGETHVPYTLETGRLTLAKQAFFIRIFGESLGLFLFACQRLALHLIFGWWAYLLLGATGGPVRGLTNHFWPLKPFSTGDKDTELFPGPWKNKVPLRVPARRCCVPSPARRGAPRRGAPRAQVWLSDVSIVAMGIDRLFICS